jgi:GTP-binding protein Era
MMDLALRKTVDLALIVGERALRRRRFCSSGAPAENRWCWRSAVDRIRSRNRRHRDYRRRHEFTDIVPISALTGENVDALVSVLERQLPEGEPLYPPETLTDLPERFFVSEIVREKILEVTREEIPYSTAVVIDSWEEGETLTRIEASILVERESQKGIVVGRAEAC